MSINLKQGRNKIDWAKSRMPLLDLLRKRFLQDKPFAGQRISMSIHLEAKTACLAVLLRDGGAQVHVTGSNPLSTQDEIAGALAEEANIEVFARHGVSKDEYDKHLGQTLAHKPHIILDDGGDLMSLLHESPQEQVIGGCEETTTGIVRLEAMEKDGALKYPVVAVNDNLTKHLMDNYYGTGQSTLDGIMRATNFMFAGKTAVVVGYGSCGKGVAMRLKGLGANVIVTEINPFRALQAKMDGFRVMKMDEACRLGDVFVTVTGNLHVINPEHSRHMKDGAVLANSGHFDCEIDVKGIEAISKGKKRVRPFMDEYLMKNGKRIYVLGEGRLINLSAAEGHPSDVMSLSFCGQALACEYLVENKDKLEAKVYVLPEEIDEYISTLQLKAMDVEIDKLTAEQKKYLASWEEGT